MKKLIAVALLSLIGLTACGSTDPKAGWVKVSDYTWKKCDGTTMIYQIDRGGSTVPNSPECAR